MLRRGFTRAEIVIVLIVCFILAGTAIPCMRQSNTQPVESRHIAYPEAPFQLQDAYPGSRMEVVVYDGCDYILWGNVHSMLTHKGNCRACLARMSVHMPAKKS